MLRAETLYDLASNEEGGKVREVLGGSESVAGKSGNVSQEELTGGSGMGLVVASSSSRFLIQVATSRVQLEVLGPDRVKGYRFEV